MKAWPALFALACVGCSASQTSYLPLKMGSKWSYAVKGDFDTTVEDMSVVGRVPVGPQDGYEIQGHTGTTRLAWAGDRLLASELAGQWFDPPVPLISGGKTSWKGTLETAGRKSEAAATLTQSTAKLKFAGRDQDTLRTDLTLVTRGQTIKLSTWFVKGIGVLKQEQRTGNKRDRLIEYLSGP